MHEYFHILYRCNGYSYSSDGSNSTIFVDEWKPIFDKFDLEADGKPDGKIPVSRFRAILDEDPVWCESVPQVRMMTIMMILR